MDSKRIIQILNKSDITIHSNGKIDIPNNIINISDKHDLYIKSGRNNIFIINKEYFKILYYSLNYTSIKCFYSDIKLLSRKEKRRFRLFL